jgi:hypothetical protein
VQSDNATEPYLQADAAELGVEPAAGTGRALSNPASKSAFNRRTLYRKPPKIPISCPQLAGPIKLGG